MYILILIFYVIFYLTYIYKYHCILKYLRTYIWKNNKNSYKKTIKIIYTKNKSNSTNIQINPAMMK